MKTLLTTILLVFFACNQTTKPASKDSSKIDGSKQQTTKNQVDKAKFYTNEDTLVITTYNQDTLRFSKSDFNEIVDNFSALYSEIPDDPDITYYRSPPFTDIVESNGNEKHISFGSEVGQDQYYILYAYFLRKQFNLDKYDAQRQKLTKIYDNINAIYSRLNFGGTYFGHQYGRITGYVEYAIYLLSIMPDYYNRSYNINAQKNLYLSSMRQFIKDELTIDSLYNQGVISLKDKEQLKKDLYKLVDEIGVSITDYFYLKNAKGFQYAHY